MNKMIVRLLLSTLIFSWLSISSIHAAVTRIDETLTIQNQPQPIYRWADDSIKPKSIIVAIHGVTLDGAAYDGLGKLLAPKGYLIVAPDLKGFGRYYHPGNPDQRMAKVTYEKNLADIATLIENLKQAHPQLPVFCLGESTGAHLSLRLASNYPQLVDGIIVSAPSTQLRLLRNTPIIMPNLLKNLINPRYQWNAESAIIRLTSNDPRIVQERLVDPLGRSRLSMCQLLKYAWMGRRTIDYVAKVPINTSVMILQGGQDKLYKPNGALAISSRLHSQDKEVHLLPEAGHILVETSYLRPDTISLLTNWLERHSSVTYDIATGSKSASTEPVSTGN